MTDVYLDDRYIGKIEDTQVASFIQNVKKERQQGKLPLSLNIFYNTSLNELQLDATKGRVRRPLIVAEHGKPKLNDEHLEKLKHGQIKFHDLVELGVIEYLDAAEEENAYVALYENDLTPEHTHLEIDPISIMSLTTSLVPYSNYGQSSRLNRGSKAQKQALGMYASNYPIRMDTDVSVLQYPQVPLVRSFTQNIPELREHPAGQNVIIALLSHEGYNMQDSIVLNQASIQRGLGRSYFFRPYGVEELRYSGGLVDEIGVPSKEVKGYRSENDYRLLEDDGIVFTEAEVKDEDVIIGKTSPPRFLGEMDEFAIAANKRRESSIAIRHGESGVVDTVAITENEEGNKLVHARVRHQRIPEVGDKFASRHGQKGVVGLIVPAADMPFSAAGIVPDIIFSPHSVPSRMTISHLIEILGGKVASLRGEPVDATTFSSEPEDQLRQQLLSMGFREDGTETMYNGITGEEYKMKIYIGDIYYLRLKHMVANKLHARASGRIQLLTRQPIEGRAKGGGLRLGEMEKDCLVAHGASLLLKERFDSDKTIVHICEECGLLAIHDAYRNNRYCQRCGANTKITPIEMSYAFKLLMDELRAMGTLPKIRLVSKY